MDGVKYTFNSIRILFIARQNPLEKKKRICGISKLTLYFTLLNKSDQWLDQPINVPLDEYVPVQEARVFPVKGNTAQLLNEFNQVYDAVELTHMTPPETPPHTPPQTPLQAYLHDSKVNSQSCYFFLFFLSR